MGIVQTARSPILRPRYGSSFAPDLTILFNGTNGSSIGTINTGASSTFRTTFANGYGGAYSNDQGRNGRSTCAKFSIPAGSDGDPAGGASGTGYGLWGGGFDLPATLIPVDGDKFYWGMWIFIPIGFNITTTGAFLKFFRYTSFNISDLTGPSGTIDSNAISNGRIDHLLTTDDEFSGASPSIPTVGAGKQRGWHTGNEFDLPTGGDQNGYSSVAFPTSRIATLGQWVWIESMLKLSTTAATSEQRLWVDNNLAFQQVGNTCTYFDTSSAQQTRTVPASKTIFSGKCIANLLFMTYWNSNSPQNQALYVDSMAFAKNPTGLPSTDSLGNSMIGNTVL